MRVDLTTTHFGSMTQNVPEMKLSNMYVIDNPLTSTGVSYVPRPTTKVFTTLPFDIPAANIRGIYFQDGFIENNLFVVSGTSLYKCNPTTSQTSYLGSVGGGSQCRFASTIYGVCIISDEKIFYFNGFNIQQVNLPDNQAAIDVTALNNYFIFTIKDDNKFYWMSPGAVTVDPLDFASAEQSADSITSIQAVSDELWIIGRMTTEVWTSTADPNAPFTRISGRIFNTGSTSATSVSLSIFNSLPCIIWVSDALEVVMGQGAINKISNDYVEEILKGSSFYRSWSFRRNRSDFWVLSTDIITLVFDLTKQKWYRWSTYGRETWMAALGTQKESLVFVADVTKSNVLSTLVFGNNTSSDDRLVCEVSGYLANEEFNPILCNRVDVIANTGFAKTYTYDPILELRWSDDQGLNWSNYSQISLGNRGNSGQELLFRSLGKISRPGRRFELRFTGLDSFRLDSVYVN